MSSLLDKLRALVSAGVRGPRRPKRETEPSAQTAQGSAPLPEVTEASPRRQKLPEVTEAPQEPVQQVPLAGQTASRIDEPPAEEAQGRALEEKRIVDLLKGKRS